MKKSDFLVLSLEENYLRILKVERKRGGYFLHDPIYHPVQDGDYLGTLAFISASYPIKGYDAYVVWPKKKTFSTLMKLPPMKRSEAKLVVANELKDIVPFTGEFAFEFTRARGEGEDFYFVYAAEREEIESLASGLERLKINVKGIILKEISVQLLLEKYLKDLGIVGFLHIYENTGSFYVFKDGVVVLSRDFSLPPGEEIRAIREEILRSVQYLKQFLRNFVMEEIFILAPPQYKIAYEEILPTRMKITDVLETGIINGFSLQYSSQIEENKEEFLLNFLPLIGCAFLEEQRIFPNLIPEDYIYNKKIPSAILVFLLEILFSAALVGGGIYLLNSYRASSQRAMDKIMQRYSEVEGKLARLQAVKRARMETWRKYYSLYLNQERATLIGKIISDFSENAPVNTVFDSVKFSFEGRRIRFEIAGAILEKPGAGNQQFLSYYDRMKLIYPGIIFTDLKNVMEADPFFPVNTPVPKVKFVIKGDMEVKLEVK